MMKSQTLPVLLPRWRIMSPPGIAFGPGKAELLAGIAETGSIGEAAGRMAMSYMRAWSLIQEMNAAFRKPLVETVRGGQRRGGAQLTPTGRRVLSLYGKMEASARKAVRTDWRNLRKLLRD